MKKNIAVVFHDNNIYSGATKSFLSNVEKLNLDNNIKVIAVVPKKSGELFNYLISLNINTYQLNYGGNVYVDSRKFLLKFISYVKCIIKTIISYINCIIFSKKIKKYNINLIYSNTSTIYFGAWLARKLKCKHVWHFREFCKEDQKSLRILNKLFIRLAKSANLLIMISESLNRYYIEKYNFTNSLVLYNDISEIYINTERNEDLFYNILITGTICEEKGQFFVIKTIEKMKKDNIRLYIAGGNNAYSRELKKYVHAKKINNIIFCDLVDNMNELRKRIDISIVSAKSEAFGRTIIEDMLSKILVIGCSTGAVPELIKNGETGLLYEYNDMNDLIKKINYAINNKKIIENITNKAFEYAKSFTKSNTAQEITSIFQELI